MGAVKRTISFSDLDGNPIEEDWYFSLEESDATDMDVAYQEDPAAYLTAIMKNKDSRELIKVWKQLLFASVGKREGNLLVKDSETIREFKFGGAYRQIFSELIDSDDAGAQFFISIMPERVQRKIAEEQSKTYSKEEMLGMTSEEFVKAFGSDETKYTPDQLLIAFRHKTSKAA